VSKQVHGRFLCAVGVGAICRRSPADSLMSMTARLEQTMLEDFPTHVQQHVKRILDAEARRLLADQLHADAISAAALTYGYTVDDRTNQLAFCFEREAIPVSSRVDGQVARAAA
jgi:hypothetical protein